jgi:hypothetical protein
MNITAGKGKLEGILSELSELSQDRPERKLEIPTSLVQQGIVKPRRVTRVTSR